MAFCVVFFSFFRTEKFVNHTSFLFVSKRDLQITGMWIIILHILYQKYFGQLYIYL